MEAKTSCLISWPRVGRESCYAGLMEYSVHKKAILSSRNSCRPKVEEILECNVLFLPMVKNIMQELQDDFY